MSRALLVTVGCAALLAQGALRPLLAERQQEAGLVLPGAAGETGAAEVAVPTLALGAFRGLVADYLWLRLLALREQGKLYEARQLAEQICRLQPRLPGVWTFLASHLAYDMAAAEPRPDGRWRWIRGGIELLRDRGLVHNPDAPELYFTLARIYLDRIGSSVDDAHLRFKQALASEMDWVLGDEPLARLAGAPSLAALTAQDAGAAAALEGARAAGLADEAALVAVEQRAARGEQPEDPGQAAWLERARSEPAWGRLLRSARADVLRDRLRLDPRAMVEVDRAWGPLDWRSSSALALYWAVQGAQAAERRGDPSGRLRLRRAAMQALKRAMRQGRISRQPDGRAFFAPDLALIGRLDRLYRESIRIAGEETRRLEAKALAAAAAGAAPDDGHGHGDPAMANARAALTFLNNQISAREDFLGEAIVLLAEYGRETDARRLLARAQAAYPHNGLFAVPYDQLLVTVMAQKFTDAGTYDTQAGVTQLVEGTWIRAFKFLALGEEDRYRSLVQVVRAAQVRWERFLASQRDLEPEVFRRLQVPWEALRRRALYRAAQSLDVAQRSVLASRVPGMTLEQLDQPPEGLDLPPRRSDR